MSARTLATKKPSAKRKPPLASPLPSAEDFGPPPAPDAIDRRFQAEVISKLVLARDLVSVCQGASYGSVDRAEAIGEVLSHAQSIIGDTIDLVGGER